MSDVKIASINESQVRLICESGVLQELSELYTFSVPNAKFMPSFQAGAWDGKIRLVNYMNRTAPKGLVPSIMKYCKKEGYTVKLSDDFAKFKEKIDIDPKTFNLPFELHDHQETAISECLRKKRTIILSSTSSGKSLIIYSLMRALEGKKILILTPRVSLVNQLYSDFEEYSENNDFDVESNCHKIFSGEDKHSDKAVFISTWQSLYRMGKKYFEQFDAIMADEVHEFEAKSCSGILDKSVNAFYRFGFTGTLNDAKTHELTLTGSFGPPVRVSSTSDLMDKGIVSNLEVRGIILKYPTHEATAVKKMNYQQEIDYIIQHNKRNRVIETIAKKANGNVLVMVRYIEKHGKYLYEQMKENLKDKEVYFVYGKVSADTREEIRKLMEKKSNIVVVASIQIFSTGINIKNLHHVILGHPTKSKIKVLQSIGRGLRLHKSKDTFYFWDIGDDFRGTRKSPTTTLGHFLHRYDLYKHENFNVKLIQKEM